MPIRFTAEGQILFNAGQIVLRDDEDPSCCCGPRACCDGNPIPSYVYLDVHAFLNGYPCTGSPKPEDPGVFNATGFVLNYIRHDPETAVCYFQYAEPVNLCGLANTIFLLQATLTTTWDHYIILGCEAGFVRADQEDEYGVYHSESMQTVGASWYLDSDCSAFDKTKTGLGNAGSIYGYWWASTYHLDAYLRVYT